jgi:hypothetical protein
MPGRHWNTTSTTRHPFQDLSLSMDTKGQFSLSCGLVSPVSLLLFVFIGLGSFSFSVPPVGSKVTTIPCSLGDSSEGAIAPLGHPWAGLEAFPDAHQTDVQHYRRQKLFSASHRAHAWVQKVSAVCPRSHAGVKPRSHPRRSNPSACKHSARAHEASWQKSRLLYGCLLPPLTPPSVFAEQSGDLGAQARPPHFPPLLP